MYYNSTRNNNISKTASQVITQGISEEGGLFVPNKLPEISEKDILGLINKNYVERAEYVLSLFLNDFDEVEIKYCAENAYTSEKFGCDEITPLAKLFDGTYMLELWHGPTCAFKDMALQILPYLLTTSAKKSVDNKKIVILVATSGDTGKAALEGFKDVEGTQIMVFYPENGVSSMQKRQMTTQEGENVSVCAVKGNFDDAQTGVKTIFTDNEVKNKLAQKDMMFSSANAINWGRLMPQIIYYVSCYCELLKTEQITMGEKINIVVPTGNFGNILAGYYAKKMGVPIGKLICASNQNNVLTDFIKTGKYNRVRDFYTTISPSMDILISSNLERLLYDLSGRNDEKIKEWFNSLNQNGSYEIDVDVKEKLQQEFFAGYCSDEDTKKTIKEVFDKVGYICDTHTAVAVKVYEDYKKETKDDTKTVIVSTASPYKFTDSVLKSLTDNIPQDDYEQVETLNNMTKLDVPVQLSELKEKQVRFNKVIDKKDMIKYVSDLLELDK